MFVNTQAYSIHTDHLGTPKAITNDKQETVWQIDLDTFGETKSIQSKDNFTFNLRFAGQYFDQESGYHYNYHRYYDPKIGRYLTSDPIGLVGGLNTYTYVNGKPWGAVDIYGLYTIQDAREQLLKAGVKYDSYRRTLGFPTPNVYPDYSDRLLFQKWYEMEKADLAKPNNWTTNLPRCPRKIKTGNGVKNGSQWLSVKSANTEHKPGVWEMRSVTVGESSNQCVYDENGNIMLEIPAAGTADRYACPHLGKCWDHTWHDLEPWLKAKSLDSQCGVDKYKKMYYEVRPILANTGSVGGSW